MHLFLRQSRIDKSSNNHRSRAVINQSVSFRVPSRQISKPERQNDVQSASVFNIPPPNNNLFQSQYKQSHANELSPFLEFRNKNSEQQGIKMMYLSTPHQEIGKKSKSQQENQALEVEREECLDRTLSRSKSKPIEPVKSEDDSPSVTLEQKVNKRYRRNSLNYEEKRPSFTIQHPQEGPTEMSEQESVLYQSTKNPMLDSTHQLIAKDSYKETIQTKVGAIPAHYKTHSRKNSLNQAKKKKLMSDQKGAQVRFSVEDAAMPRFSGRTSYGEGLTSTEAGLKQINEALRSEMASSHVSMVKEERSEASQTQSNGSKATSLRCKNPPQSSYQQYIMEQSEQLKAQVSEMQRLTSEADRVLLQEEEPYEVHRHPEYEAEGESLHMTQFQSLMKELIELFTIGELIKAELQYRSFEVLSRMYAEAESYYSEQIELTEPISVRLFTIILKAVMPHSNPKELKVVVDRIFENNNELSFEQFLARFESQLNCQDLSVMSPRGPEKNVNIFKKVKKLFLSWIQAEYYEKKIKQLLHRDPKITEDILNDCEDEIDAQSLCSIAFERLLFGAHCKSNAQKLKIDIFLRFILGNSFRKERWSQWAQTPAEKNYDRSERQQKFKYLHFSRSGYSGRQNQEIVKKN